MRGKRERKTNLIVDFLAKRARWQILEGEVLLSREQIASFVTEDKEDSKKDSKRWEG